MTSNEISKKLNVHAVRIRKTLSTLKKAHYISSLEGSKGGFSINCNTSEVSLGEIYRLTISDTLKPKCHECCKSCSIGVNIETVLNDILQDADQNLQDFLKQYSLDDVLRKLDSKI